MMRKPLQCRLFTWQRCLLGCLVWWLYVWAPGMAWPETPPQAVQRLPLEDGAALELTPSAILRKQGETVIWSVDAAKPQLPLFFKNSAGVPLLFYYIQINEHSGEYHAVRIENGQEQWTQPVWSDGVAENPVSLVFLNAGIYIGRGLWLEQMNADNGQMVERYLARTPIQMLRVRPDGKLEIQAHEKGLAGKVTLTFQDGRFHPYIAAPANLVLSRALWKRAHWVMPDFDWGLESLNLYQVPRDYLALQTVLKWRDFDLRKVKDAEQRIRNAEDAYRRAYQSDPTNSAFALYLALTLYYQQRYTEAEVYKNEALQKSAAFWEESLRLGGFVCEALHLTPWADEFYAQGTARYFQDVPAPPQWAMLIEILTHLQGQRLAAAGPFDRALRVLEMRRQIIPYTEGDSYFSREYARILRKLGQHEQAATEARRIGGVSYFSDFLELSPFSFYGVLMTSILIGSVLFLHHEIRHRSEWWLVLLAVVGTHSIMPVSNDLKIREILIQPLILLGYVWVMTSFQRRRETLAFSPGQLMLGFAASSYIVLLTTMHLAYLSGQLLSDAGFSGSVGEILIIGVWFGVRRWLRGHKSIPAVPFRHLKVLLLLWGLFWCHMMWLKYDVGMIGIEAQMPLPSIDYGHPNWQTYIDQQVRSARFPNQNLRLMQAVVHQLGEDYDFARQAYQRMPEDVRALNNLGVLSLVHNSKTAKTYFAQALKLKPGFAPALYNLGVLTNDARLIEQAQTVDPWRVKAYQIYSPGKSWIAIPTLREWVQAVYWSQSWFLNAGFTEFAKAFILQN